MTAALTCEMRAVGALNPDPKLRNSDRLAAAFCTPIRLPFDFDAARALIDADRAGYASYFYVNARSRYIDDLLVRGLRDGVKQVVVLGAGFDSRAYRFHALHPETRYYEIDRPGTIRAKRERVMKAFGQVPPYVALLPIDFETGSLRTTLLNAGFRSDRMSLFILEGVAMYVSEEGMSSTLNVLSSMAMRGSIVVLDYRIPVDGSDAAIARDAQAEEKAVARLGEPFRTSWTPASASAFLRSRGFRVNHDVGVSELRARYLEGTDGKLDGEPIVWYRILDASVR